MVDTVKYNVHMADIFKIAPHNGAMNYFDSAKNDILSVYYQNEGVLQKLRGRALISSLCWPIPV